MKACRAVLFKSLLVLAGSGCSAPAPEELPEPGVSLDLAQRRAAAISAVSYDLFFSIPSTLEQPVSGIGRLEFELREWDGPLVLDFAQPANHVMGVWANGKSVQQRSVNEHLLIPASALETGRNRVHIEFVAGDAPLNRQEEFLFTLFVPDRAREAFPCFDQPNLKARYRLTLEAPADWLAVANAPLKERRPGPRGQVWKFEETLPLSTYLFAFAAGKFQMETAERLGRQLTMYHRETDAENLARNRDAVFDLHAVALKSMELYTGIDYPFQKFDFVLIPAFQYGGMEHPGAVLYRSERLLLDASATQSELLGRASLIAHETAHMWFGDLTTMKWFDDVWTKEVFANFLAAKIVNPSFPKLNHELRFMMAHYPAAYEVDRSAGANPIRQPLKNLNDAGSLYGAIIYQKAPIVMKHLERLMGEEPFRQGLRSYLNQHRYGNASWPDLIEILDRVNNHDLKEWSRVWVEEPGRPLVRAEVLTDADGQQRGLRVAQSDPQDRGRIWNQRLEVPLLYPRGGATLIVQLDRPVVEVELSVGPVPRFLLLNGEGTGYARFQLDPATRSHLLQDLADISDSLHRGAAWISLWDAMLYGEISAREFIEAALRSLPRESDELNVQQVLDYAAEAYWRYLPGAQRESLAPRFEKVCWDGIVAAPTSTLKATYFEAFRAVALTDEAAEKLRQLWKGENVPAGLTFSESDDAKTAAALAIRGVSDADEILAAQLERMADPDRKARFVFILPSLSRRQSERDRFFESLKDVANRRREAWVLDGLENLHHPLRAAQSEKYVAPSLEMLEEIHRTGDIFFPKRWLDAVLSGHRSESAAAAVRGYLDRRPDLEPRLRGKVLQSADGLFRAVDLAR